MARARNIKPGFFRNADLVELPMEGRSMTCPDCTAAATNADWGGYHAACTGCQVRALASGMEFFTSKAERRIAPAYRAALRTLFGEDADAGHQLVKEEFDRIGALRNSSKRL